MKLIHTQNNKEREDLLYKQLNAFASHYDTVIKNPDDIKKTFAIMVIVFFT